MKPGLRREVSVRLFRRLKRPHQADPATPVHVAVSGHNKEMPTLENRCAQQIVEELRSQFVLDCLAGSGNIARGEDKVRRTAPRAESLHRLYEGPQDNVAVVRLCRGKQTRLPRRKKGELTSSTPAIGYVARRRRFRALTVLLLLAEAIPTVSNAPHHRRRLLLNVIIGPQGTRAEFPGGQGKGLFICDKLQYAD